MNKKFSTLVAGLLLAASFGTVGAQTPAYTMFTSGQTGTQKVATFKKEGAFQLADASGKVLAMVKDDFTGKYELKMVAADGSVKLAETLWTIRWTSSSDAVKKYYFTFESAAYHMPLSFSTEIAGKGSLTTGSYEFPGKIGTWEWQEGIEGQGIANNGVELKYRFANPDSVMTLAASSNGLVGAVKYAQKDGFTGLALSPKSLNGVVLTPADLNSKMLTQDLSELMKLTFNADVSKDAENLWTNKYEAINAIGENEINKAVVAAINKAIAAAKKANSAAEVASVVRELKEDVAYKGNAAALAVIEEVAAAAEKAATPAAAKTAAAGVKTAYETAVTTATNKEAYAKDIQAAYANSLKEGTVSTISAYKKAVAAVAETAGNLKKAQKAEVQAAFIALVDGKETDTYVQPADSKVQAAVLAFTTAKEDATAASTVATAANKKAADLTIDAAYIADAVTAVGTGDIAEVVAAMKTLADDATAAANANAAVKAVVDAAPDMIEALPSTYANYISLSVPNSKEATYLRVDTNYLTGSRGSKHLAFRTGAFKAALTNSKGKAVDTYVQHDYNGRYNFLFTYYPTEDSLVINTPVEYKKVNNVNTVAQSAGYAHPLADKNYLDMSNTEIADSWSLHQVKVGTTQNVAENIVKIVVLNDAKNHREVTIGANEWIEAENADPKTTLNTRIGFNVKFDDYAAIPAGVYTIKYVSNETWNKDRNGRYITYNWLENDEQFFASVENQELNHIPAAQWIVTQAKGESLNSIVNRESAEPLYYRNQFGDVQQQDVQQQYVFATATKGLYRTLAGDSLLFTAVPAEFTADKTLGYFANKEEDDAAADELQVYGLKYLNDLNDDLFVGYNEADSILNVAKTDADDMLYFRLVRATDSLSYGPAIVKDENGKVIAQQLKRIAYYLQLETPNKNVKEEDKLYITEFKDGKYKLQTIEQAAKQAFFLKEFKEAGTHYYALIEAGNWDDNNKWNATLLGETKISVKDYPSILVQEDLEGENQAQDVWGWAADGRTSTFGLVAKDAPKYRRLGVTNKEDGLNNLGTNIAKINVTREANRYLYENTENKVAGYEADPTGINYLGALFNGENKAAMFIDTAYVRNETARPQYLLGLRPDFTPDTTFCPVNHGHAYELVDQVRANYLVTLADSVAAYKGDKKMLEKFMFENRTYTRLAFVDAVHQGDSLVIMSSKFKGTKEAKKDTIDLSKNAFNNAAVQFRLTKNDDQTAEFYIEVGDRKDGSDKFVRLINGVAVLTTDIADAERFNIAKTDDKPVANEGIETATISVVATNGAVIVKGAAGKKVAISNVLGQTIANTTVTSDEATIAAPAGVVVVAVEGEAAVKAIVK